MSGAPKRLHEDIGKYPHEDSQASYPNHPANITGNDYHMPFESGQEARIAKMPRVESRDSDKRAPLPMYRLPSSSNDSHNDHFASSEFRMDPRDLKDKADNRETKVETRELYMELKRAGQSSKGDDSKETKYDKDTYNDSKVDMKMEKDGYGSSSSHLNFKLPKEHHRVKRYPEAMDRNTDPWAISRGNVHETIEERDSMESHEAVGENKVDSKGDEKSKEKDRKRKDGKHRDWGEREKESGDCRNNLHIGNSSIEGKESRQERDLERWKDLSKDKERPKEREKDHFRRESSNGVDNEKELVDGSIRISENENQALDQKKQKEFGREGRDKRKERDVDGEGDRSGRFYDKESDEGGMDVDGGNEREREVFSYGVQQRKRMLRPRGSPQVGNREARFRSRTQDTEGGQGKPEISTVTYKVGECMQELIKLWKEHESSLAEKNGESSNNGPTLEIRIPAEHVTATNRQVRGGQLWGTDVYTDDSDLVAVLMHTGYCRPTASTPPPPILELCATIRVLPPQDSYISTLRNNVRSRAWGAAIGCSYRVERCCIVKRGGGTIDLEPCLTHTSTVEPTLAPVAVERTMTTRAAASNALRQQRFVREVTIQYNLCNEPWIKYSISIVADKGLKKPLYTSARLKKGEVLYLETHSRRYELCFTGERVVKAPASSHVHESETEKPQNHHNSHLTNGERNGESDSIMIDVFRWSRCKTPLPQKVMRSIGIPLPHDHVEVLEENVDWEDVQWSQTGVWIAGKEYPLARVHFLSPN